MSSETRESVAGSQFFSSIHYNAGTAYAIQHGTFSINNNHQHTSRNGATHRSDFDSSPAELDRRGAPRLLDGDTEKLRRQDGLSTTRTRDAPRTGTHELTEEALAYFNYLLDEHVDPWGAVWSWREHVEPLSPLRETFSAHRDFGALEQESRPREAGNSGQRERVARNRVYSASSGKCVGSEHDGLHRATSTSNVGSNKTSTPSPGLQMALGMLRRTGPMLPRTPCSQHQRISAGNQKWATDSRAPHPHHLKREQQKFADCLRNNMLDVDSSVGRWRSLTLGREKYVLIAHPEVRGSAYLGRAM